MFADDTAIYYSGTNMKEIEKKLNADLAGISIWIKANGLALNVKKTGTYGYWHMAKTKTV